MMLAPVLRATLIAVALLSGCSGAPWNNPYPAAEDRANILYSSFSERPKHLDPVQSYSSNEITFTAQIYEPPLQYHYLKRPYVLMPLSAESVPEPRYLDARGKRLQAGAAPHEIATTVYEVRIKRGIRYQPHPAFALGGDGKPLYQDLTRADLAGTYKLSDFKQTGTRELNARDFEYQIKRLAHPRLHSPIFELMADYIVGLKDYAEVLKRASQELTARSGKDAWLDLSQFPLAGVEVVDDYTYRVRIRGQYPQFLYWLAMPFFAPVPLEVDRFFGQPGMAEKNLTLDWYPVGTGPYMLTENDPNRVMVLERNPNFHGETYPSEGEPADSAAGLLKDAGKPLPFIDKAVFSLEKESIPYWNKFLQGYYDGSGIASDTFDQAVQMSSQGEAVVTESMEKQGISLSTSVAVSTFYMGFNMLDPVVGGFSERARKLRQAISIAVDYEEYVSIFRNGRGIPAQGPIAPGIFGYRDGKEGINPVDVRLGREGAGAQANRGGAEAARRGGLSERHRRQNRRAAGAQLRRDRAQRRCEIHAGLDAPAIRKDQHPARDPRHRLQPFSGQDPHRQRPDLRVGLARRLSRPRELPVPAPRPPGQGQVAGRERGELRKPGVRPPVRENEEHAEFARAAGHYRPDGRHPAARRALAVGIPPHGLRVVPLLVRQPEAQQDRV